MSVVGTALQWGGYGLNALIGISMLKDMLESGDDSSLLEGMSWSKGHKRNMAQLAEARWVADIDAVDATQDVAERRLTGKLAELSGFQRGGRMPAGVLEMQDQRHMMEMSKLYKNELSRSAVDSYPTLAELAAKTNLL